MQLVTLKKRREFLTISDKGQKFFTNQFIILAIESSKLKSDLTRFGFTVSKKIGNAPTRNKVKRRLKFAVRSFLETNEINSPHSIVIIARSSITQSSFSKIEQNILYSFKKLKLV